MSPNWLALLDDLLSLVDPVVECPGLVGNEGAGDDQGDEGEPDEFAQQGDEREYRENHDDRNGEAELGDRQNAGGRGREVSG